MKRCSVGACNATGGLAPRHEVGLAMPPLCREGWLAALPGVQVQLAHGGGSFLFALERLQRLSEDEAPASSRRTVPLARVTVDSASPGPAGIAATHALLGRPSRRARHRCADPRRFACPATDLIGWSAAALILLAFTSRDVRLLHLASLDAAVASTCVRRPRRRVAL